MGQIKGNPIPSFQNQGYETLRANGRQNRDGGTTPVMIHSKTTLTEVIDATFATDIDETTTNARITSISASLSSQLSVGGIIATTGSNTFVGNQTITGSLTVNGNLVNSGLYFSPPNFISISGSGTQTLSNTTSYNILNMVNAGYTVTLNQPPSPANGQQFSLSVIGNTVTLAEGSGTFAPTFAGALTDGLSYQYTYYSGNNTWYRF